MKRKPRKKCNKGVIRPKRTITLALRREWKREWNKCMLRQKVINRKIVMYDMMLISLIKEKTID